jgi:uncharacterized protein YcaQ
LGAHAEAGAEPQRVAPALAAELQRLANWLELGTIRIARRGDLAAPLGKHVRGTFKAAD